MNKMSTCCTCGYQWQTGKNGSHNCSVVLQSTVKNMQKVVKTALTNIVSSIVKQEDAPCASSTHLNMAAVNLLTLLNEFNAEEEEAETLLFAIGEYSVINQVSN